VIAKGKPKAAVTMAYAASIAKNPSVGSTATSQDIRNKDARFLADR